MGGGGVQNQTSDHLSSDHQFIGEKVDFPFSGQSNRTEKKTFILIAQAKAVWIYKTQVRYPTKHRTNKYETNKCFYVEESPLS